MMLVTVFNACLPNRLPSSRAFSALVISFASEYGAFLEGDQGYEPVVASQTLRKGCDWIFDPTGVSDTLCRRALSPVRIKELAELGP
jgi:hypothetical protein